MLQYIKGDIFNSDAEAIVNTVNCVGVMGRGIALQFKNAYPDNFKAYESACKKGEIQIGKMFVFPLEKMVNPKYIINFPTKEHWRSSSRIEFIKSGLSDLHRVIHEYNIRSICIPPLGCGLGGLNWHDVRSVIETSLANIQDVKISVFLPTGAPEIDRIKRTPEQPKMTVGRAALVGLLDRYLNGLLSPFVTLLEVHKLMYFMQEAGENLRLRYKKADYGPFAENLGHVLKAMEGYYTQGYGDGGDSPEKEIELLPNSVKTANNVLSQNNETLQRFNRVADLVDGFEDSFGMELLTTVHWSVIYEKASTVNEVFRLVYDWNERKKQMFSERQIRIALKNLYEKGWLADFWSNF